MKGRYVIVPLLVMSLFSTAHADRRPLSVSIEGQRVRLSPEPEIRRGVVFVPVTLFRLVGLAVEEKDKRNAWIAWPKSDGIFEFCAGRRTMKAGALSHDERLPGTPFLRDEVLMVPIRAVFQSDDGGVRASFVRSDGTVQLRYSRHWIEWRIRGDWGMRQGRPGWYLTPVLGRLSGKLPSQILERAETLQAAGRWREAVALLHGLIERRPFDWRAIEPGQNHTRPTVESQAYSMLARILEAQQPSGAEPRLYAGIARAVEGDASGAESEFAKGVQIDPRNADLQAALGWAIIRGRGPQIGDKDAKPLRDALQHFETALVANPSHRLALSFAAYGNERLAYMTNYAGGYTDQSRAEARPYLSKSIGHFDRMLKVGPPSESLKTHVAELRRQLR